MLFACLALTALIPSTCLALAQQPDTPLAFHNTAEEDRFHALTGSLRCVMCQNESLADSQAMIARDLRRQILAMMRAGQSDVQIRQFLVARYGEFVLYQPRVEPATWLLWFGPPLLFAAGAATVFFVVRQRSARVRRLAANLGVAADTDTDASAESSEEW